MRFSHHLFSTFLLSLLHSTIHFSSVHYHKKISKVCLHVYDYTFQYVWQWLKRLRCAFEHIALACCDMYISHDYKQRPRCNLCHCFSKTQGEMCEGKGYGTNVWSAPPVAWLNCIAILQYCFWDAVLDYCWSILVFLKFSTERKKKNFLFLTV